MTVKGDINEGARNIEKFKDSEADFYLGDCANCDIELYVSDFPREVKTKAGILYFCCRKCEDEYFEKNE